VFILSRVVSDACAILSYAESQSISFTDGHIFGTYKHLAVNRISSNA